MEKRSETIITQTGKEGYTTEVMAGPFKFIVDEPEISGGNGKGPNPYALVLAALGSCTGITLTMYSRRNNYPLNFITIYLKHFKNYGSDCLSCENSDSRIDVIERELVMDGPLTEVQINRLLEIAGKCPVSKTLEAGIRIETKLKKV